MGVHEPHFRSVSFGDTGDQILNVAEGSTDHGAGLARAKPGFYLQLPLPRLILDELEIQVQMLEIMTKLASRILGLDQLGLQYYLHIVRDVHGLGGQYGLHFRMRVMEQRMGERKTKTLEERGGQRRTQNPNATIL